MISMAGASSTTLGDDAGQVIPLKRRGGRSTAVSPSEVLEKLRAAAPLIEARAPALDELGAFPTEDLALLHEIGALEVFAGDAPSPLELMEALRLIGRANLSLGRIVEGHVNGAKLVRWYGDDGQRAVLAQDLRDHQLFGVWNTEPEPVTIVQTTDGNVLKGRKSYATGAGHVDRIVITATLADGNRQLVVADGAQPDRADLSAWKVRGMRATGSGLYELTGLPVTAANTIGQPGDYIREPRFSSGAWRFTAVQLGGVERVLTLLRSQLAARPEIDPIQAGRFAEVLASVRSAYLWVREAALRAEGPDCGRDEIALVLMTRGVVEKAGLKVMEAAARTVGTKAFFEDNPLDQACRDLAMYLRQPVPDQARDRAARAFIAADCWAGDRLW